MFKLISIVYAQTPTPLQDQYSFGFLNSLGQGFSLLVPAGLELAGAGATLLLLIGIFRYIISGGDKNAVAAAKAMIYHTVIGILLLLFMFLVYRYLPVAFDLGYQIIK